MNILRQDDGTAVHDGDIRIFMDGAFDMMHYGHMNALRQGKSLGVHLIVGVNASKEIAENKGTS